MIMQMKWQLILNLQHIDLSSELLSLIIIQSMRMKVEDKTWASSVNRCFLVQKTLIFNLRKPWKGLFFMRSDQHGAGCFFSEYFLNRWNLLKCGHLKFRASKRTGINACCLIQSYVRIAYKQIYRGREMSKRNQGIMLAIIGTMFWGISSPFAQALFA